MLIIVEGIDRVGKTTLVNRINKKFNIPVYRHVGERDIAMIKNDIETDRNLQILEICRLSNSLLIFDRFHWTDFVYGCIQRHYDFTEALNNKDKIERMLSELQTIIIFVKPSDIKLSSFQHGCNLNRHEKLFEFLYNETCLDKTECTYDTLCEAEDFLCKKIKIN